MYKGIRPALNDLLSGSTGMSENHDLCVELLRQYFCHYYFPFCNMNATSVVPVCTSSCNLLFNNEECMSLLMEAIALIKEQNITVTPSSNSCERRFVPLTRQATFTVANICISIEG